MMIEHARAADRRAGAVQEGGLARASSVSAGALMSEWSGLRLGIGAGACLATKARAHLSIARVTRVRRWAEAGSGARGRVTSWRSIRARRPRAPCCLTRISSVRGIAQEEFAQHYPASGWVEHDPEDIWRTARVDRACRARRSWRDGRPMSSPSASPISARRRSSGTARRASRSTTPSSGRTGGRRMPVRRSCEAGARAGRHGQDRSPARPVFLGDQDRVDPRSRFPAHARKRSSGELAFGTVETRSCCGGLTGGRVHATDATNASRTSPVRYQPANVGRRAARRSFNVPRSLLPQVHDNAAEFGATVPELFGAPIPIRGMAGDQQAATIGQACFEPGMLKSTYGTGCFAVLNTGRNAIPSRNGCSRPSPTSSPASAPTRSKVRSSSPARRVQWLRDKLKVIASAPAADVLAHRGRPAAERRPGAGIRRARRALLGSRLPRRALWPDAQHDRQRSCRRRRSIRCASRPGDLLDAMRKRLADSGEDDLARRRRHGRVDWTMQRLADILDAPVDRPTVLETTALGAAYLAGLQSGFYPEPDKVRANAGCSIGASPELAAPERAPARRLARRGAPHAFAVALGADLASWLELGDASSRPG